MSEAKDTEALRAQLKALREAREAREAAALAASEADRLQAAIEAEAMAAANADAIAEAESKYGKVGVEIGYVTTRLGVVILKRSHSANFRKFQDLEKPSMLDVEKLVGPCIVHPSRETFDKWNDELPGVLSVCAKVIGNLAGAASADRAGKSGAS